ncbi:MAG TPA: hypothetical protein VN656_00105 [Stellaceae bacterium]|nr:hypothetical protein [Stellaceae bacterium]
MSKFYGLDEFEEGSRVKIASHSSLEAFQRDWRLHHPLQDEQLDYADHDAKVSSATMYHGGDILYVLEGVPGVWHQSCLVAEL